MENQYWNILSADCPESVHLLFEENVNARCTWSDPYKDAKTNVTTIGLTRNNIDRQPIVEPGSLLFVSADFCPFEFATGNRSLQSWTRVLPRAIARMCDAVEVPMTI